MSYIADLVSIGASLFVVSFALWMVKQLFTDNK
jgi:hypothetical protein